jgi:hypothetical protein
MPSGRPIRVAIVAFEGVSLLDLTGPTVPMGAALTTTIRRTPTAHIA